MISTYMKNTVRLTHFPSSLILKNWTNKLISFFSLILNTWTNRPISPSPLVLSDWLNQPIVSKDIFKIFYKRNTYYFFVPSFDKFCSAIAMQNTQDERSREDFLMVIKINNKENSYEHV